MRIFISYDMKSDSARKAALEGKLTHAGYDVVQLPAPGQTLATSLAETIDSSDACVWIVTESSVDSGWCPFEVSAFWGTRRTMIILDEAGISTSSLPEFLAGELRARTAEEVLHALSSAHETDIYHGTTENLLSWPPQAPRFEGIASDLKSQYSEHTVRIDIENRTGRAGLRRIAVSVDFEITHVNAPPRTLRLRGRGQITGGLYSGESWLRYETHQVDDPLNPLWGGAMYISFQVNKAYAYWLATGSTLPELILGRAQWVHEERKKEVRAHP